MNQQEQAKAIHALRLEIDDLRRDMPRQPAQHPAVHAPTPEGRFGIIIAAAGDGDELTIRLVKPKQPAATNPDGTVSLDWDGDPVTAKTFPHIRAKRYAQVVYSGAAEEPPYAYKPWPVYWSAGNWWVWHPQLLMFDLGSGLASATDGYAAPRNV